MQKEINIPCILIPENQRYWFVRTQGGRLFEKFIAGNFIAIGWNKVTIKLIQDNKKEDLQKYITKNFPKENRHGLTASHMIRFAKEMNIGDIVVIPSKSSKKFSFGRISSDAFEYTGDDIEDCDFIKRRKISWIKTVDSDELESALQSIKYSETAVSNVDSYSHLIDRALGGFLYQKGTNTTLTIEAGNDGNIKLIDLNNFLTSSLELVKKSHPEIDIDSINIKLNLQSRGKIIISCITATAIFFLGSILYLSCKEDLSFKINILGTSIEAEAHGKTLLESYSDFQDRKFEREIKRFRIEQEKMKVSLPEKNRKK